MRRLPLPALAVMAAITLLGYFRFPGHTYLQSDTQIYVPILEHLHNPRVLASDIVATTPHVSYTIYDEVSLGLRAMTGLDFEWVLTAQQIVFRFAGVFGVFLMATSLRFKTSLALLVTAFIHLGATIGGPAVLTVEYEPVPRGFALPLILCALGLLAHERYGLAGLAGALAALYHPPTVLPLVVLTTVLTAWPSSERRRRSAALWPILAAIGLIVLLSRVQPGVSEKQVFFSHIDAALEKMQRYRATYNWVSMWPVFWFWHHIFLWGASFVAFLRTRAVMPVPLQFCFTVLPLYGMLTIPGSYLVLETMKWSMMPQLQPARAVLFVTLFATLGAALAGVQAGVSRRYLEAAPWFFVVFAVPVNVQVLPLLGPGLSDPVILQRLVLVLILAGIAVLAVWSVRHRAASAAWVAAVVLPFFLIPGCGGVVNYPPLHSPELDAVAGWAKSNTEVGDVFLFPDAGHGLQPGVFRSRALRTVYVDWKSGGQVNLLKHFAEEWWRRWHSLVPDRFEAPDFPLYAKLNIRYIVLQPAHRLADRQPAFENAGYLVYRVPDVP